METGTTALAFASYDLASLVPPESVLHHDKANLPQGSEITLETEDVNAAYDHAITQGMIPVTPPTDMP